MSNHGTWIADDLSASRRGRRLAALGALVVALGAAAALFLSTSPPTPQAQLRDPGTFGHTASVDLLPGYDVDEERRILGPARIVLTSGQHVFVPARTPFSGASPCRTLRLPEAADSGSCALYVWFAEDGRSAQWLTLLRPGGPGESLVDGRLLAASDERLVLADGTSVQPASGMRLSECGSASLGDLAGRTVVVSIDDDDGRARQVTCRV